MCNDECLWFREMNKQIAMAGIPARYLNVGGEAASFKSAAFLVKGNNGAAIDRLAQELRWGRPYVAERIAAGHGLYLFGRTTGTGKTTVAAGIILDYIRRGVADAFHATGAPPARQLAQFVHVPTFLRQAKQIYEDDPIVKAQASADVAALTRRMMSADLLLLDDLGAEKPSEAVRERLLTILDARWSKKQSIIVTSNKTLQEIEIDLTSRIRSRIEGMTLYRDPDGLEEDKSGAVEFGGRDHRRKGA